MPALPSLPPCPPCVFAALQGRPVAAGKLPAQPLIPPVPAPMRAPLPLPVPCRRDPAADVALLRGGACHLLVGTPGRLDDVMQRCAAFLDMRSVEVGGWSGCFSLCQQLIQLLASSGFVAAYWCRRTLEGPKKPWRVRKSPGNSWFLLGAPLGIWRLHGRRAGSVRWRGRGGPWFGGQ